VCVCVCDVVLGCLRVCVCGVVLGLYSCVAAAVEVVAAELGEQNGCVGV